MALGSLGFLAALALIVSVLIGGTGLDHGMDAPFIVAFLTIPFILLIIIAIELLRVLSVVLLFIGRKTGLLRFLT
jgi:hypothetical protein